MALENRVTPFGQIVAVDARGTLMGNRGCLHDESQCIVKSSARDAWLICRLQWKGIRRPLMAPGKYTELFFLDEATALAAGHRPCNDCRAERLDEFKHAWAAGIEGRPGASTLVSRIDPVLKRDRREDSGRQRKFEARINELPDGVVVQIHGEESVARLLWGSRLLRWAWTGYTDALTIEPAIKVRVLTPASTVKALAAGYVPDVHSTAGCR
jgi:hypothetical protein